MEASSRIGNLLLLVLLAAIWGGSFLFIKVALVAFPPLSVVAGRVLLGALALWLMVLVSRQRLPREPRIWLDFLVVACIGNLLPFFLIAWGELVIDSALAAILMGTMPLSAVLLTHLLTEDEKLTRGKLLGVLIGLVGIVVLVGPEALKGLGLGLWSQLAIVGAGCGYALGGIYTRRRGLTRLPAAVTGTGVLAASAVLILPLTLIVDRPWDLRPGPEPLLAMLGLGILSTGIAYVILFRLLALAGVTFVALNNYLVPLFGLLWGFLILGEAVPPSTLGALGLILMGIGLIQSPLRRAAGHARTGSPGVSQP